MKRTSKFNKIIYGLIPGILLPGLTLLVSWMIISESTLDSYLRSYYMTGHISGVISLCAIPNLLIFFIFIWLEKYQSARGVIYATILVALVMLIFKYVV